MKSRGNHEIMNRLSGSRERVREKMRYLREGEVGEQERGSRSLDSVVEAVMTCFL